MRGTLRHHLALLGMRAVEDFFSIGEIRMQILQILGSFVLMLRRIQAAFVRREAATPLSLARSSSVNCKMFTVVRSWPKRMWCSGELLYRLISRAKQDKEMAFLCSFKHPALAVLVGLATGVLPLT